MGRVRGQNICVKFCSPSRPWLSRNTHKKQDTTLFGRPFECGGNIHKPHMHRTDTLYPPFAQMAPFVCTVFAPHVSHVLPFASPQIEPRSRIFELAGVQFLLQKCIIKQEKCPLGRLWLSTCAFTGTPGWFPFFSLACCNEACDEE